MLDICVLVVGLGSMGKRRGRLIQKYDRAIKIIGIDQDGGRRREAEETLGIVTEDTIADAVEKHAPSCAFICTSPLSHAGIISECLDYSLNIFTELNLVPDGYGENIRKAEGKGLKIFMSSTLQYRKEIQFIKEEVKKVSGKVNYIYHVGQYLPDWHPWENYKDFFVGDARSNGCREILAVDLPWLVSVFGGIENIMVQKRKGTTLEIDYPDTYQILLRHGDGTLGVLAVDVVSRKAVRNLEIYGEDFYLEWDGSPDGLKIYDVEGKQTKPVRLYQQVEKDCGYPAAFIVENMYSSEIEAFFDYLYHDKKPLYCLGDDWGILKVIDQMEGMP